jgi:hypothetical protein
MTPTVSATVTLTDLAPVATAPLPPRGGAGPDATVAIGFQARAAPIAKRRSRKRVWVIVSTALVALLLLALGICAAVGQPTLAVSPSTVVAGESVVVDAVHLPANQVGEIRLQSQLHVFPFRADQVGVVSKEINVPSDIELGDHLISICWNGSCHAHTTLVVTSAVSQTTPGVSTPSPGSTPTSTPPSSPGTRPTATPRASPTANPTPTSSPTPAQAPVISASPSSALVLTTVYVTGQHFSPFRGVSIFLFDPANSSKPLQSWSAVASANGDFRKGIVIPASAPPGTARIIACDSNRLCASTNITVI